MAQYQSSPNSDGDYTADIYSEVQPQRLPGLSPQQAAYLENLRHAEQVTPKEDSFLGDFSFDAEDINFAAQNPREKVFVFLRAHLFTNIGWVTRSVLAAILPLAAIAFAQAISFDVRQVGIVTDLLGRQLYDRVLILVLINYYALIITNSLRHFINWYYNIYIVTNERAIDYRFKVFVSYDIAEARIQNIEDVKEKSVGLLPSLFRYGDVILQTAAARSRIDFTSVPRPSDVRDIITDIASFAKRIYGYNRRERTA